MEKPTKGIVVDGATSGNPGPSEYRGIDLETGKLLFHVKVEECTNNLTEFLALVHGIMYCKKEGLKNQVIYSDSLTAIAWVNKKEVSSNLKENPKTEKAFSLLLRAKTFLYEEGLCGNYIEKWRTNEWGVIPADFGRKEDYIKKSEIGNWLTSQINFLSRLQQESTLDSEKASIVYQKKFIEKFKKQFNIV